MFEWLKNYFNSCFKQAIEEYSEMRRQILNEIYEKELQEAYIKMYDEL